MKRSFAIALLVLIVGIAVAGYLVTRPSNSGRVLVRGTIINVEFAKTDSEKVRGLSGRDNLGPDQGMLFFFEREGQWPFWMKDMRFPLDIIWFDANQKAIHIEQNLPPCATANCPIYFPSHEAMYVLEVNAGFVQAHNLVLGDNFIFLP